MVLDDAENGQPPRLGMALTTVAAHTEPAKFVRDVEQVRRFLKRELAGYQGLSHIEFTTGKGQRSGGHRRIHSHELVKSDDRLTAGDLVAVEEGVRRIWEARTGAHRVEVAELRTAAGAAHYLTHHHSKRAQLPPAGWKGRRYRPTRGYFALAAEGRRARARDALLDKNLRRRVKNTLVADGLSDVDHEVWDELLRADLQKARELTGKGVELVRVMEVPTEFGADDLPIKWELVVAGPANE
jgi:hypothetical protein